MSKKIYISGAMASRMDTYKEEFAKVEKNIDQIDGLIAVNPAILPVGLDHKHYMPICLKMIDAADAIYMMKGWEKSKGAVLEKMYAEYQEKEIIFE